MQLANLIPNQHVNFLEDKANEILKNHSISKPWEIDIENVYGKLKIEQMEV